MTRRSFTGFIVLLAIVLSILYLAQPWKSLRASMSLLLSWVLICKVACV